MDTSKDATDEHVESILGLSPEDFRSYLIESGIVTTLQLAANPELVVDKMNDPEVWDEYVADRTEAKRALDEQQRYLRGG